MSFDDDDLEWEMDIPYKEAFGDVDDNTAPSEFGELMQDIELYVWSWTELLVQNYYAIMQDYEHEKGSNFQLSPTM